MAEVIYRQRGVSGRAWAVPFVLWVVAALGLLLFGHGGPSGGSVVAAILVPGIVVAVWLLTLWSINRYGDVSLTRDTLRVGRDQVPVADLRRDWVHMLAGKADPTLGERLAAAGALTVGKDRKLGQDRGRLLGGAYGNTLGRDLVTLELDDGSRVSVPTRDRVGLLRALLGALGD